MKKIIAVLLCVLTLASAMVFSASASSKYKSDKTYTSGDYKYKILSDGTAELYRYIGKDINLTIPSKIDGITFTAINTSAFFKNNDIVSVVVPGTIKTIRIHTFNMNKGLEKVTIKNGVQKIGDFGISECPNLKKVIIPESVTELGEGAFFQNPKLSDVSIGNNITKLGGYILLGTAYYKDKSNWSGGILYLGNCAVDVDRVALGVGCDYDGMKATYDLKIKDGTTIIANDLMLGSYLVKSITIPSSVKKIESYAFRNCYGLTKVTIKNGVETIGDYAFYDCALLKNITIPKSVKKIGKEAFGYKIAKSHVGTDPSDKIEGFKISGYADTAAEKYAKDNKFPFTSIDPHQAKGLKQTQITASSVTLTWSKVADAKYYKLQQSTDGKKWTTVATTKNVSYKVSKLKAGTTYQFRVITLDSTQKIAGKASAVIKATTLCSAPTIKVTSTKSKTATVSITKVTGAKSYIVYKSTDGKTFKKAGTTTKTTYNLTKLTGGKKIYVKAIAVNANAKNSAYSSVKSVTVKK